MATNKAPQVRRLTPAEFAARRDQDSLVRARAAEASPTKHPTNPALPVAQPEQDVEPATQTTADSEKTTHGTKNRINIATNPNVEAHLDILETTIDETNQTARRAFLESIKPFGPKADVAAVKTDILDRVETIAYTSQTADRSLVAIGVEYARWVRANSADNTFQPERDLNDFTIDDYINIAKDDVAESTRGTYRAQLRRLGRGDARPKGSRPPAQPPYARTIASRMWQTACDDDHWTAVEMRTLLACTLGAGARSEEIHRLLPGSVSSRGRNAIVQVVDEHGRVRETPVYGSYARWLIQRSQQVDSHEHLFRPGHPCARRNAINSLVRNISRRHTVFQGFKAARARNTWLCQVLEAGLQFSVVCDAAGIRPGSHAPTDVLRHLPHLTLHEVHREFDRAFTRRGNLA